MWKFYKEGGKNLAWAVIRGCSGGVGMLAVDGGLRCGLNINGGVEWYFKTNLNMNSEMVKVNVRELFSGCLGASSGVLESLKKNK